MEIKMMMDTAKSTFFVTIIDGDNRVIDTTASTIFVLRRDGTNRHIFGALLHDQANIHTIN
jgi:hypothetical protein